MSSSSWLFDDTSGANALAPRPLYRPRTSALTVVPRPVKSSAPSWLATVAAQTRAQAASQTEKPRGLLEQLTDPITHFLPGVVGFLADAVETAVAPPRLLYDATLGSGLHRDENYKGLQSYLAHYAPAVNTLGTSIYQTGHRFTHPAEYMKAIKEGRIVDAILQDVGNVALVGAPFAKALGVTSKISTGLGEGAARALEARGATLFPEAATEAAAGAGSDMAGSSLLRPLSGEIGGQLVDLGAPPSTFTAQIPGRGLAGMLERGGNLQAAETVGQLGRGVRTVTSLGETVGNAPARPFAWAGRQLARPLEGVAPSLSNLLAGKWAPPEREPEMVNPYEGSRIYNALRKSNQMWKTAILPTSPKWLIGNTLGNMLQASIHAGIDPITLVRRMNDIAKMEGGWRELWRNSGFAEMSPEEIASHGLTHAEYLEMRDRIAAAPHGRVGSSVVGRGFRKGINFSWKLNEFVDNMTRQATYLEKIGKGVPNEAAIQSVLRSLGDFRRMTPVEQNLVRQVLPFYSWLRHQTLATLRLPLQSPTRAAMLATLGDIYSDPKMENDILSFVGSKFPLGGNLFLDAGGVSPLADVGESAFGPFDPRSIGGQLAPAIKLGLGVGFGFNPSNLDQLGRPPETKNVGVFGEEATPPITRLFSDPRHALGEIGYLASQQAPAPIRSIRDLLLGPERRYGTGYAVPKLEPDPNKTPLRLLLRGLNLPSPMTIDPEELQRNMDEARKRLGQ